MAGGVVAGGAVAGGVEGKSGLADGMDAGGTGPGVEDVEDAGLPAFDGAEDFA